MKTLSVLIVLTALALFGSNFFGLYAVPGLEDLPTAETLGKERGDNQKKAAGANDKDPSGIFPVEAAPFTPKGNSAAGQRARQINQNQNQIAPGS